MSVGATDWVAFGWSTLLFFSGYIFGLVQGAANFRLGHESRGGPGTCLGVAACTAYLFREDCPSWLDE